MRLGIPVPIRIGMLLIGTTALYTYIGQLVPQKPVMPPEDVAIPNEATTEQLVEAGHTIANDKGICFTCHTIGKSGDSLRFPDLDGIASRAETRIDGLSGLQYMARSMYYPDEFIVEGFNPGMPKIDKPPIGLTELEILAVLAYLQSLGGTPSVTLETTKADLGVE